MSEITSTGTDSLSDELRQQYNQLVHDVSKLSALAHLGYANDLKVEQDGFELAITHKLMDDDWDTLVLELSGSKLVNEIVFVLDNGMASIYSRGENGKVLDDDYLVNPNDDCIELITDGDNGVECHIKKDEYLEKLFNRFNALLVRLMDKAESNKSRHIAELTRTAVTDLSNL